MTGFTRARSMGGVAEAVRRAGGSVERVFRRAELPLQLIDCPDQVILLRDQLALVEHAAHAIGDDALAPRLSLLAGFRSLGPLAGHILRARSLEEAIRLCNQNIGTLLQSATHMWLAPRGHARVAWCYSISDTARLGRHRNEVLALGYMLDLVRHLAGPAAAPCWVELPGEVAARQPVCDLLGCEIRRGPLAALVFPASWLALRGGVESTTADAPGITLEQVPSERDLLAGVAQLMRLALLDGRPTMAWMSRRLGMAPRSLQRRLALAGGRFEALRDDALAARAAELLRSARLSVTEIAYELGYTEPAHFTRAARRWSGMAPSAWRQDLRARAHTASG
ncbi:AraC family transcriptional regulator [Hydrogenophaga palleronii]|uniref:AraC family transcriptional regulator n=1 Tax=Hydrogenophaga palleronii TaxID=65655 RepID=UPI00082405A7|nr:AraC family transcriptional regulator [Hydrogenophaga palleronii]